MRYLAVHHRQERPARELLAELDVQDVVVVVLGKGRRLDEAAVLTLPGNSEVILVGVRPKLFKKHVVCFKCATITGAGLAIRQVLAPGPPEPAEIPPAPETAFRQAAQGTPALIIAPKALDTANELPTDRHQFAAATATLLARWARTGKASPSVDEYLKGLNFCRNSTTTYEVRMLADDKLVFSGSTQWHVSKGNATNRVHAARIYFLACTVSLPHRPKVVVVLHVGPHPPEHSTKQITLRLSAATLEGCEDED